VIEHDTMFVGGKFIPVTGDGAADVLDSHTEEVFGRVALASATDANAAVTAARNAFDAWSSMPVAERAELVASIGPLVAKRADELATIITREVGTPTALCESLQVGLPAKLFGMAADVAAAFQHEEQVGGTVVRHEPLGVVACITPWNFPLNQIAKKVSYAMAAGCTVVVKPSEVAPLDAYILAEAVREAGLPPGVFNVIVGLGPVVGEALASHPEVDMVSLTGSTRAGIRVFELAARTVKRLALELGGKGPSIVLGSPSEETLGAGVEHALHRNLHNSGQACGAITRLVVPRANLAATERLLLEGLKHFPVGNPFTPGTEVGPLVSAVQRDRVRGYIKGAIDEGIRLVVGGVEQPDGLPTGYYVRPTIFSDVDPGATIAQEEVFGPVLAVIPSDDDDHAIEIANGTQYGLSSSVWANDPSQAAAAARRIRSGQVSVNGAAGNHGAPTGGFKRSGVGREYGRHGYEEFLELKSVHGDRLS
jgi:acyl-CoA reductase-like NAD-dependent aldehyde dehydrogenase